MQAGSSDRWFTDHPCHITVDCAAIDAGLVRAGVHWLAMQANRTRLDAVIVVPSLADADRLACALPRKDLDELVRGNIVRMNQGSLLLLTPDEMTPSARQHTVVLGLGLNARELERVDQMNPAASLNLKPVRTGGVC